MRGGVDWPEASGAIVESLRVWGRLGSSTRLLLYDPLPEEVDLRALVGEAHALLTRTPDDGELTVHRFDAPRETHRLGFSQPVAGEAEVDLVEIDVVLLPGLAFDRTGVRLGRGGGHYDRLLPRLRDDCLLVGVAPAVVVVDHLPREDHDMLVSHLATEGGVGMVRR